MSIFSAHTIFPPGCPMPSLSDRTLFIFSAFVISTLGLAASFVISFRILCIVIHYGTSSPRRLWTNSGTVHTV